MRFHSSLYFLLKKGIKPHPVLGCLSRFAFGQGFTRQQKLYSFISHLRKKVNRIKNSPSWDLIISNEQLTSRSRYTLRRVRRMTPYFLESSSARHYSTTPDNLPQEAARDQEVRVTSVVRTRVIGNASQGLPREVTSCCCYPLPIRVLRTRRQRTSAFEFPHGEGKILLCASRYLPFQGCES